MKKKKDHKAIFESQKKTKSVFWSSTRIRTILLCSKGAKPQKTIWRHFEKKIPTLKK